jgi:hypothetical protein
MDERNFHYGAMPYSTIKGIVAFLDELYRTASMTGGTHV